MNAIQRLTAIVAVVEERGFYAMGKADAEALQFVIARAEGQPQPAHDAALFADVVRAADLVRALAAAGWNLSKR